MFLFDPGEPMFRLFGTHLVKIKSSGTLKKKNETWKRRYRDLCFFFFFLIRPIKLTFLFSAALRFLLWLLLLFFSR